MRVQFLENQRLNVGALPDMAESVWKEVKDSQEVRYNSSFIRSHENIYLSRTEEHDAQYNDGPRGSGARGRGFQMNQSLGKGGHTTIKSQLAPSTLASPHQSGKSIGE